MTIARIAGSLCVYALLPLDLWVAACVQAWPGFVALAISGPLGFLAGWQARRDTAALISWLDTRIARDFDR